MDGPIWNMDVHILPSSFFLNFKDFWKEKHTTYVIHRQKGRSLGQLHRSKFPFSGETGLNFLYPLTIIVVWVQKIEMSDYIYITNGIHCGVSQNRRKSVWFISVWTRSSIIRAVVRVPNVHYIKQARYQYYCSIAVGAWGGWHWRESDIRLGMPSSKRDRWGNIISVAMALVPTAWFWV